MMLAAIPSALFVADSCQYIYKATVPWHAQVLLVHYQLQPEGIDCCLSCRKRFLESHRISMCLVGIKIGSVCSPSLQGALFHLTLPPSGWPFYCCLLDVTTALICPVFFCLLHDVDLSGSNFFLFKGPLSSQGSVYQVWPMTSLIFCVFPGMFLAVSILTLLNAEMTESTSITQHLKGSEKQISNLFSDAHSSNSSDSLSSFSDTCSFLWF